MWIKVQLQYIRKNYVQKNLYSACFFHVHPYIIISQLSKHLTLGCIYLRSITHTIRGALYFQFTHFPCDDWENLYTLSYYHHQIGVWTITHCLGLVHETMLCSVSFCILTHKALLSIWRKKYMVQKLANKPTSLILGDNGTQDSGTVSIAVLCK